MRTIFRSGSLIHDRCMDMHTDRQIGVSVFHVHTNALVVARLLNKRAGRKYVRVAVIDSHFHVVPVSGNLFPRLRCDNLDCTQLGERVPPDHRHTQYTP